MATLTVEVAEITDRIRAAVRGALDGEIKTELERKIKEKAETEVYSYAATPQAMIQRRGQIGSETNLLAQVGGEQDHYWLTIENITQTQNPASDKEIDIVEEGYVNYRQPYPRPFMEKALEELVSSGRAEEMLINAVSRVLL